jgi:endonuclease IV
MSFGPHVNRYHAQGARPKIAAHIEAARREAEAEAGFNITAAAIFVGGPHDRRINLQEIEGADLKSYLARTGIRAIAHSSYSAVPWRGDPDAARFIREEAGVCQAAGISGLVVHLPKAPVAQVMRYIARLYNPDAPDVRIYLETPAVRPRESHYETPVKLAALFKAIRADLDPELRFFGLCIDTAHLWTCGIDLQSYEAANAWLVALEAAADVIPPDGVMIHMNDSARLRGVGPDTHAPLAQGKIWGEYRGRLAESGLAAFTDYAQRHDTVCILERKPKEALKNDYLLLRELVPSARAG